MDRAVGGWEEFVAAATVFLVSHALPARPAVRGGLTRRLGRALYLTLYSAVSLMILAWLIAAAGRAPYVELWPWAPGFLWVTNLLALPAILLAVAGTGIANPFSLGGVAAHTFDPDRPGIVAITRHPLLWALVLWAFGHVLANGNLAHALLFGSVALFALLGIGIFEKRARRTLGADFSRLSAPTSVLPCAALLRGEARLRGVQPIRIVLGLAVWAVLLVLHRPIIGVSPLPPV